MISGKLEEVQLGGWFSFDLEENLLFYGTGNPAPWNPTSASR